MSPRKATPQKKARHTGFSLIEILVAIVVLSLGLLGLAALQMTSLRFNQSAHLRTQATTLASDIFDCIRANRTAASSYAISYSAGAPGSATVAASDLSNWKTRVTGVFGATGQGAVEGPDAEGKYTVRLRWSDAGNANAARSTQEFIYVALP